MPKGVRLNPAHDERTRAKIQTSQIINRLIKLVNGEIEMNTQQVRAAEILLKKTLPDLQSTELTGKDGQPLIPEITKEEAARRVLFMMKQMEHEKGADAS